MNQENLLKGIKGNLHEVVDVPKSISSLKREIKKFFGDMIAKPISNDKPIEEIYDSSRDPIELITQRYTYEEVSGLPHGSLVLQLDGRLDKLVITPYIISDDNLVEMYKAKHLNQSPIIRADQNSTFVVLHIGKKITMKENVLEGKQKLDVLVALLGLEFRTGSYIAEPTPETAPDIVKDKRLRIGSSLHDDVLDQAIALPIGTVFVAEDRNPVLQASVLIVAPDNKFLTLNSGGITRLVEKSEDTLLSFGLVVIYTDNISEEDVQKLHGNRKYARKAFLNFQSDYSDLLDKKLRSNPRKGNSNPFNMWRYKVNPKFRMIKQYI